LVIPRVALPPHLRRLSSIVFEAFRVTLGSSGLPGEAGFLVGVTHRRFVAPLQEFLSASHLFLVHEAAWRLLRRQGVKSP
jgi:hypothetical protein